MSSSLQPRPVKPRRILHWARASLDLIGRRLTAWLIITTASCVACALMHRSLVLQEMAIGTSFLFGMGWAACVDSTSLPGFGDMCRRIRRDGMITIRFAALVTVANALGSLVYAVMSGRADVAGIVLFDTHAADLLLLKDGPTWNAINQVGTLSGAAFFNVYFCVALPMWVSMFQYLLISETGLDFGPARVLGRGGMPHMNLLTLSMFGASGLGLITLTLVLCPVLIPLAIAFISAMTYVAFREIFLGQTKNTQAHTVRRRSAAGASA